MRMRLRFFRFLYLWDQGVKFGLKMVDDFITLRKNSEKNISEGVLDSWPGVVKCSKMVEEESDWFKGN